MRIDLNSNWIRSASIWNGWKSKEAKFEVNWQFHHLDTPTLSQLFFSSSSKWISANDVCGLTKVRFLIRGDLPKRLKNCSAVLKTTTIDIQRRARGAPKTPYKSTLSRNHFAAGDINGTAKERLFDETLKNKKCTQIINIKWMTRRHWLVGLVQFLFVSRRVLLLLLIFPFYNLVKQRSKEMFLRGLCVTSAIC